MLLLFAYPLIQLFFAYKTSFYNNLFRADSVRKVAIKLIILVYYIWYASSVGIRIYNEYINDDKLCIFIGDQGQQDWSDIIFIHKLQQQSIIWTYLIYFLNIPV